MLAQSLTRLTAQQCRRPRARSSCCPRIPFHGQNGIMHIIPSGHSPSRDPILRGYTTHPSIGAGQTAALPTFSAPTIPPIPSHVPLSRRIDDDVAVARQVQSHEPTHATRRDAIIRQSAGHAGRGAGTVIRLHRRREHVVLPGATHSRPNPRHRSSLARVRSHRRRRAPNRTGQSPELLSSRTPVSKSRGNRRNLLILH